LFALVFAVPLALSAELYEKRLTALEGAVSRYRILIDIGTAGFEPATP
jgi:hypothetical protein